MNDAQLLRYSRHILLNELGVEGQEKLLASHALVIGAGGLGSPVALYLGSAGVGRLTVIDDDTVDETNLQRQIAHNLARVGRPKAESVREAVAAFGRGDVRNLQGCDGLAEFFPGGFVDLGQLKAAGASALQRAGADNPEARCLHEQDIAARCDDPFPRVLQQSRGYH